MERGFLSFGDGLSNTTATSCVAFLELLAEIACGARELLVLKSGLWDEGGSVYKDIVKVFD